MLPDILNYAREVFASSYKEEKGAWLSNLLNQNNIFGFNKRTVRGYGNNKHQAFYKGMAQLLRTNATSLDGPFCHLISKSSQIKLHGLLCPLKKTMECMIMAQWRFYQVKLREQIRKLS